MKKFRAILILVLILLTTNSLPADAGILRRVRHIIVAPVFAIKHYIRDVTYENRVAYFFKELQ